MSEQSDNKIHQNLIQTINSMLAHDLPVWKFNLLFFSLPSFYCKCVCPRVGVCMFVFLFNKFSAVATWMSCGLAYNDVVLEKRCQFETMVNGLVVIG